MGQNMARLSFFWNNSSLIELLAQCRFEQGRLLAAPTEFVHSLELSENQTELYSFLIKKAANSLDAAAIGEIKALAQINPSSSVNAGFEDFLIWWNEPPESLDPVLRAGVAFVWAALLDVFPLACALAEVSLQQFEKTSRRPYDLFRGLLSSQNDFLTTLALNSKSRSTDGALDLTPALLLFLKIFKQSLAEAALITQPLSQRDIFWIRHRAARLNSRQKKALEHVLKGDTPLTNRLYVSLTKTTRETAKRDLAELVRQGLLEVGSSKGRSVSYFLSVY